MVKQGEMKGAPGWYGTPLDRLNFEWSEEEQLELAGYCRQIQRNIVEFGGKMSPRARLEATLNGGDRDRIFLESYYFNPYAVRTLDPLGVSLKPGDVCKDPKLLVKAHMATVAQFGLDMPVLYPTSYAQEIWGADVEMTDYGNPAQVGGYPVKTLEDLEGLDIPDPRSTGICAGYLWACREIKRLFVEHGLDKLVPLSVCIGNDPLGVVGMFMMGWTDFMRAARKNPEVCHKSMEMAAEWTMKMGQAVIETGADSLLICSQIGFIPLKGNEWILAGYEKIGRSLGSQIPCWYALTYERALDWFTAMREQGAVGPGSFRGWFCAEMDYKKVVDISRENDVYCCCALSDVLLSNGPVARIEDGIKALCDYGKSYSRFAVGIAAVDYGTPQENFAAAVAAARKYGQLS